MQDSYCIGKEAISCLKIKGSVRPGLTFRPIIFLRLLNARPLAGPEFGKGAMCPRPDELLTGPCRCRQTRRLDTVNNLSQIHFQPSVYRVNWQ